MPQQGHKMASLAVEQTEQTIETENDPSYYSGFQLSTTHWIFISTKFRTAANNLTWEHSVFITSNQLPFLSFIILRTVSLKPGKERNLNNFSSISPNPLKAIYKESASNNDL